MLAGLIPVFSIGFQPATAAVDWTGFSQIAEWFYDDCPEGRPCQLLTRQLWRDSLYCNRGPQSVLGLHDIDPHTKKEIRGTIAYAGFITNAYRYTLSREQDMVTVEVRIHLYRGWNPKMAQQLTRAESQKMSYLLQLAARKWTLWAPEGVQFRFLLTSRPGDAHFSVRAIDSDTRGPYHFQWSLAWDDRTIAHEVGHMMGLDDEYEMLNSEKTNCPKSFMMCNSWGRPQPYYYYLILRRAACV